MKNIFYLVFVGLLFSQCQKDDVDVNFESEQQKKELSEKQKKALAKKTANSTEFVDLWERGRQQAEMSVNQIRNKEFYNNPEEVINKDGRFNRKALKKRLWMTSYKSVDELIQDFNETINLTNEIFNKYPETKDSSVREC